MSAAGLINSAGLVRGGRFASTTVTRCMPFTTPELVCQLISSRARVLPAREAIAFPDPLVTYDIPERCGYRKGARLVIIHYLISR